MSEVFRIGAGGHGFPVIEVDSPLCHATLSSMGAHLLEWTPSGCATVLWMSGRSRFSPGCPIRGGVPVCAPWFGPSNVPGRPAHGIVRAATWNLEETGLDRDGSAIVRYSLARRISETCDWPFIATMSFVIGKTLEMTLEVTNTGGSAGRFSGALHTYFSVSDISSVSVEGLSGARYFDKVQGKQGVWSGAIREIDREFDNVFMSSSEVTIHDAGTGRGILVSKMGSGSTVVWNPWADKAARMPDFGDDEYHGMICVESANALDDERTIAPGEKHLLSQKLELL